VGKGEGVGVGSGVEVGGIGVEVGGSGDFVGGNGVSVGIGVAVALGEVEATVGGSTASVASGTWAIWVPHPVNIARIRQQVRIHFVPNVVFILPSSFCSGSPLIIIRSFSRPPRRGPSRLTHLSL
jgi:hypothetical protein